jgi:hypothetical protein
VLSRWRELILSAMENDSRPALDRSGIALQHDMTAMELTLRLFDA